MKIGNKEVSQSQLRVAEKKRRALLRALSRLPRLQGAALRRWRSGRHVTQAELATALGVSRRTILRSESQEQLPVLMAFFIIYSETIKGGLK